MKGHNTIPMNEDYYLPHKATYPIVGSIGLTTLLVGFANQLNGHAPGELYDFVLGEMERPLLEVVMNRTRGNISKAAQFLGLNRATLRKKLERYGLNP